MAANQSCAPAGFLGWPATIVANASSLALSAAGTWLAFQFIARTTKTLNKVRLFASTITGSPATTDLTCDLYSDNNGIPGASIESHPADSIPASGNWMQWSGFTTAPGSIPTPYWIVFKNVNGTPGSNNATYQWAGAAAGGASASLFLGQTQDVTPFFGFGKVGTVNSGTAWATAPQNVVAGPRLQYSDGTYDGMPVSNMTRPGTTGTGDSSFGKQEVGVKFNVPAGAIWNVRAAWVPFNKTGTPGAVAFKMYQGATLMSGGTTYAVPVANISSVNTGDFYYAEWASPLALSNANGPYRLTINDATGGDTSANRYSPPLYTWDGDSNSQLLRPMDGTLAETVTTDNTQTPPTFTDTVTSMIPFILVLDSVGGEVSTPTIVGAIPATVLGWH